MNKKILLGLSATLLTAIPLVAVVSCTESSTNKIDSEANKFRISVETTKKDLVSTDAANTINAAPDNPSKLTALKNLVSSIPTLDSDFDFNVKSAMVNTTTNTTIDVLINVFEKEDTSNKKDVTYSIKGFIAPSEKVKIEDQAKLFDVARTTTNPSADPEVVMTAINGASSSSDKWNVIKGYVNVPTLANGFELEVGNAVIREGAEDAIDVSIKIIETATPTTFRDVTLKIEGFVLSSIETDINLEVAKFGVATTKSHNTSAVRVVENINGVEENDRLHALSLVVSIPTLTNGYDLKVKSANINSDSRSTVDVLISVFNTRKPDISQDTVYEIREFRISDIETEAARFKDTWTTSPNTSSMEIVEEIQSTDSPEAKIAILSSVADLPTLEEGYSFQIHQVLVDKYKASSILVVISIVEEDSIDISKSIVYSIDGFKSSTLEIEAAKFNSSRTTNVNLSSIDMAKDINLASTPEEKLNALGVFAKLPTLEEGFDFEVKSANVNGTIDTTVEVLISIYETGESTESIDVIYLVTGLKRSTVDIEAAKFERSVAAIAESITRPSVEWVQDINEAINDNARLDVLKQITVIPTLAQGFGIKILGAETELTSQQGVAIDVHIRIFDMASPELINDFTLIVYGFHKIGNTPLEIEEAKFNTTLETVLPITIEEAIQRMSNGSSVEYFTELKAIVSEENVPTLSEGYTFQVLGIVSHLTTETDITIAILIYEDGIPKGNAQLVITGFLSR
ncbi:MAG: hypothetical protein ACRCXE_01110 [Metamycoplasmataceae bacterium]